MSKQEQAPDGTSLVIASEATVGRGEDAYSARTDALGGFLCVADGCGGIGTRRYARSEGRTGAYLASRLAVKEALAWAAAMDGDALPAPGEALEQSAGALETRLRLAFEAFERANGEPTDARIVVSMQRALPTTLCVGLYDAREPDALRCRFLWAGDSRAYLLDSDGLRQCTADHLVGRADAMENLYHDARLSNLVSADRPFRIESVAVDTRKPCVALVATDGAFAYLPTPMEFELMLLHTLREAKSLEGWRRRLSTAVGRVASDDSTLLLCCFGYASFEALQASMAQRREELQRRFVTPVRRRKQDVDFARERWKEYRRDYELNGEKAHEDRRV